MIFLRLFCEFFKAGLFAVGGGLATLPFLYDISDATGWFTHHQLVDMVAISESTPGPIGINMATYVGFTTGSGTGLGIFGGILGVLAATIGLVAPSVIIVIAVAKILQKFSSNKYVQYVFSGLRPASVGMIGAALYSVMSVSIFHVDAASFLSGISITMSVKALILAAAIFVLSRIKFTKDKKTLHPAVWLLLSAIVGIIFKFGE